MADKIRLGRRGFLAGLAGSCAAVPAALAFDGKSGAGQVGGVAYSRTLPVKVKTDVFIAGGGSAGVAAAVAARAAGAKVFLAEGFTCFGGMGTAARVHLPKSVPFGYHLLTNRLQFSTDPFSQEA